jgi:hypothetical protein
MAAKPGVAFGDISGQIQTFDLILFRGGDFVSGAIADIEEAYVGVRDFTHSGIAVRAKDISKTSDLWRSGDDTLYVFESTASGQLVDGVSAVTDRRGHLGVQLRDMSQVVKHYDVKPITRMAWLPLQETVRSAIPPRIVDSVLERYMNVTYAVSCIDLAAAASPLVRKVRDCWLFRKARSVFCRFCCCGAQPNTWLFCSELCAQIYKDIGVFPDSLVPADVMPVDFLPEETSPLLASSSTTARNTVDSDHQVPWVFRDVIRFHATPPRVFGSADDFIKHPESSPL